MQQLGKLPYNRSSPEMKTTLKMWQKFLFFSRQQAQENSTTQQQYRGVLFPIFQTMWLNSKQLMLYNFMKNPNVLLNCVS